MKNAILSGGEWDGLRCRVSETGDEHGQPYHRVPCHADHWTALYRETSRKEHGATVFQCVSSEQFGQEPAHENAPVRFCRGAGVHGCLAATT